MRETILKSRGVIRLSGDDAGGFLQGLVTSDMTGALPAWSGLLSPQGKVLFDFIVWPGDRDGDILIDCEAERAGALVRRLSLYRLRRAITIATDPALAVHWSPDDPVNGAPTDPRLPALGFRWLAAPGEGDASDAWRAHRLALGVTEGVAELGDGETLWLECNAAELNGVSFTKGCYVGQENTARMNWRQKVNRRLLVVPLASSAAERQRAAYPALGLAVDHLRVDAIDPAVVPAWLGGAFPAPGEASSQQH